ncbi:MAG: translocation/assembly module TamB domain-containing protein [Cyclobacteriaceae bacterium]
MSKASTPIRRVIKVVSWIVSILVLLFVMLVLAIRTPQVQTRLTGMASSWLESKTGAQLSIDRLFLTFRGDLQIDELLLATPTGDTLVYSHYLEVGASLPSLLEGDIALTRINWRGVVAEIKADASGNFNFQFIIDAFDSGEEQVPEPGNEPIFLELGPISLENIRFRYADDQNKININSFVNQLALVPKKVDLEQLIFHVAHGSIDEAEVEVVQFGVAESSDSDTEVSLLPEIIVDALDIQNIDVRYSSTPDSLDLITHVGEVAIRKAELDLNNSGIIGQLLRIDQSQVTLTSSSQSQPTSAIDSAQEAFAWPEWTVDLGELAVNNTSIDMSLGLADKDPLFIDLNQMDWDLKAVQAAGIHFSPGDIQVDLQSLSILEHNQNLQVDGTLVAGLNQKGIELSALDLSTATSHIRANLNIGYGSFDSLINHPLNSHISAKIEELELGVGDLKQLSFLVSDQPSMALFLKKPIRATGDFQYSTAEVNGSEVELYWSDQTQLQLDGQVLEPWDSSQMSVALSKFRFATRGRDMEAIKTAFDLPVDLPGQVTLAGQLNASMTHLDGTISFKSDEGSADMRIALDDSLSIPVYKSTTNFRNIDLGKWLKTEQLGTISGMLTLSGQGLVLDQMISNARMSIHTIDLLNQRMDSIDIGLSLDSGRYAMDLSISEPSIEAELSGKGEFSTIDKFTTDIQLSLGRFDLHRWQMAEDSILVSSNIDLQLERSTEQNSIALKITDSKFLSATAQHRLKPISIDLTSSEDTIYFDLTSGLFRGDGQVNASIEQLIERSTAWVSDSVTLADFNLDQVFEGLIASANIKFNPTSDQFEQIWPQLDIADTIRLSMAINQAADDYQLTLRAPSTSYKSQQLTNLGIHLFNREDTINYEIGVEEFRSGPAQINQLSANGSYADLKWRNALRIAGSTTSPIIQVDTESRLVGDTVYTHIVPESLRLDSLSWTLPQDNEIVYYDGNLLFHNFLLRHDNDLLEISSTVNAGTESLDLRFEDFQLRTLTSIINATEYPATGEINGFVDINGIENHPTILADLEVKDLVVLEQYIGLLQWKSKSDEANGSLIDLSATSPQLDIKASGSLDQNGMLDLQMKLNKVAMTVIEGFSDGTISKASGYMAGELNITGPDSLPDYKGSIDFRSASFMVTDINAPFSLEDESIRIDNELISFDNFTIRDEQNNILELNGNIRTEDFTDPAFDFQVVGKDFQLLNSTAQDNDLYYGKVAIDINLGVKGRLGAPTVDVTARLNKGSNFTYVLPESQLEIEEREGVVMFFNQNDSSTLKETARVQPKILDIEGVQFRSKLTIDPETNFKMIIDKRSGDYLEIGGEANLDINIDRKGKTTMSGIYTARKGAYEVRLYEIVQRRFEVVPGSRIIWSGDPFKAELDLTAQYNLRTSVKELMEEQVANADPTTKVSSQQDLPFEVLLRIQGSLEQPLMSFRLDMPEGARNELGGNIYARINQINENEDELNKQVFSLIAFNQFLPSAVTNASGSTTSNLAKSSVNQILSSQLNNLSQRYIKGIDVDFNLNSFSDYQTGSLTDRTELSVSIKKALFDDRVIISVGNSVDIEGQTRQTNEWIDDVTIEYLLTEDGRYRLKGFQKNSFDDLVEGQVTITGLSLLFSKEFNQFKNIFNNAEVTK